MCPVSCFNLDLLLDSFYLQKQRERIHKTVRLKTQILKLAPVQEYKDRLSHQGALDQENFLLRNVLVKTQTSNLTTTLNMHLDYLGLMFRC